MSPEWSKFASLKLQGKLFPDCSHGSRDFAQGKESMTTHNGSPVFCDLGIGSSHDFHDTGGNLRLSSSVVGVEQALLELRGIIGCRAHGIHPGCKLACQGFLQKLLI